MPFFPRVTGVFRSLIGRGPVDRDLDADVDCYFDMLVDEKMAAGISADEARRQAQLEMDGVDQVKEAVRAVRPAVLVDTVVRDLRYSVRLLAKTPAFSATAILVLALGIAANTAVFTLINMLCFRPLPGSDQPGKAVAVYARDAEKPDSYRSFSYADYEAVRDHATVFDHVMAHTSLRVGVTEADASRRTKAALATGDYFATLGVRLAAGRSFSPEEERPGSRAAVMVLSHPGWQRLGSPRNILGKTILVNSRPFTVIGIAPAGFVGRTVFAGPEFWMPLGAAALFARSSSDDRAGAIEEPGALGLMLVGRLKPGVTMAAANAAVGGLSGALGRSRDGASSLLTVNHLSRFNQSTRPGDDGDDGLFVALGALEAAALVVLIIASLNVANMQLARGSSRRKEIAMRLALGAGRWRIVGQLMIEGLILSVAGGALGMVASVWTLDAVVASFIPVVPDALSADVSPDWWVAVACLACCTLSALAFGLGPSWKLSRVDLLPEMRSQDGTGAGSGLRRFGTRNLLVAGQIALSLALLAASGLFVRGAVVAGAAEPGYRFEHQFLVRLDAATGGLDEASGRQAYRELIERIRSTPGVESAAVASNVAFANESSSRRVWRPGTLQSVNPSTMKGTSALSFAVGASYFKTLGLSMLRGREFTRAEELDAPASEVAIVDEPLATALFPGQDPVGQFVESQFFEFSSGNPKVVTRPAQIVGVVPGVRHRLADTRPVPHIYLPLGSHYQTLLNIHVRTAANGRSDGGDVRAALRDTIRTVDTKLAVLAVQTLDEARDATPMNWVVRAAARTFGCFGVIALFMATIGLYGVKAYLVARRTREIGIRMAIGAGAGDVIRMVLKEGALLLAVSIGVGFLLAVGVGQAVSSLLVGVRPFDPLVLSIATLVLSGAVLTACYVPARRATRISPMTALRVE
jgi:predicted permease